MPKVGTFAIHYPNSLPLFSTAHPTDSPCICVSARCNGWNLDSLRLTLTSGGPSLAQQGGLAKPDKVRFAASAAMPNAAAHSVPPRAATDPAAVATIGLALVLAGSFYALFWVEWRNNPDLSHALFTPVLFLILLHESRTRGPWRWLPASAWVTAATALTLTAGLGLMAAAGLFAAALDWSHALVGFLLAAALAVLLLAALLGLAGERVRVCPLNWPAVAALALWPLSAPIPPGTYTRLTSHLQLWVTGVVLHLLNLLGVPAVQTGNVITLTHTSVGVEEACSGVRSLMACVVAGLFFSATLVRRPAARGLLLVLAAPLALGMNLVRSFTLTLLANAGVDISGAWHDLTGFAILGVTAALLGGLALLLESREPPVSTPAAGPASAPGWSGWLPPSGLALAGVLVTALVLNTHPVTTAATATAIAGPDLAAIVPAQSPGWEVVTTDDLHRFTSTLATNHLIQRNYVRRTPDVLVQITIYLAWWPAGSVPVSLVESHTPEACWPGTGWVQQPTPTRTVTASVAGRELPAATYLFFKNTQAYPQHTWYWHLNAGRPIQQINALSPRELLGLAWHYGLRTSGEQLFVRISSNQPWAKIAGEPLLTSLFAELKPMGL